MCIRDRFTTYDVLDTSYTVPCDTKQNTTVGEVVTCPVPLKLRNNGDADPPCQLPCPTPYWTDSQYNIVKLEMYIFCPLSFVCSFWLCWCWISQKRLREFPANLPLFPSASAWAASVIWIVSSIIGHERIWCENEFTLAKTNFLCGTQAFALQTVFMICAFYWFFIALTLFLLVGLEVNVELHRWYRYVVHIISLGAPLAFAIIMFAAGAYEYSGGGWCNPQAAHHHAFDLSLSWGWILLFLLCTNLFALGVFAKILWVRMGLHKNHPLNWRYFGMLLFVVIFTFVFGWGVSYFLYILAVEDKVEDAMVNWVLCNASLKENCKNEFPPSFWFYCLVAALWQLSGVWALFCFGLRESLHKCGWYYFREGVLGRNVKLLWNGVTDSELSSAITTSRRSERSGTSTPRSKSAGISH
eukprot:TRINITY_DN3096_c0_g1_i3.p1 TRINITY_DN3096_c0_g1~~TRINITY_DN3096_c0_g1_i3.p1  ORF type:complete len:413 (+),score=60.01 TRINITY_DN3096_c0_g1_i3:36-1274(+)